MTEHTAPTHTPRHVATEADDWAQLTPYNSEEGRHAATYHGIASATCLGCGTTARDRWTLEVLNDLDAACLKGCETDDGEPLRHVRWTLTDGTVTDTYEDEDGDVHRTTVTEGGAR
jgi:hypothetical protein